MRIHALKTKIITPHYDWTLAYYAGLPGLALVEQWDEPAEAGTQAGLLKDPSLPSGGGFEVELMILK